MDMCRSPGVAFCRQDARFTVRSVGFGQLTSAASNRAAQQPDSAKPLDPWRRHQQGVAKVARPASTAAVLPMALGLLPVAAWVAGFPSLQLLVAAVLVVSCVAVWRWPHLAFAILPAALPVFDLAPWSGRFFFDEFDALVLAVLMIAWVRAPRSSPQWQRQHRDLQMVGLNLAFKVVTVLLVAGFAVSVLRGLWPWAWPDANSFNNYFSTFNSLRIAKGALWAALLWHLSRRFRDAGFEVRRPFAWGMSIGLVMTVAWIFWERALFTGIFNFDDGYRVTGPFSATHTGGAYVDTFIAAAVPFLVVLTARKHHWSCKFVGGMFVLASTFALMVTYSRAGYLAFGVAVALVLAGLLVASHQKKRNVLILVALAATMLAVAFPVYKSSFMQSRLASVGADFEFRKAHWADALAIRDADIWTTLLGMGVGRFPDTKYWRSELHPKISTYSVLSEKQGGKDNTFLRLDAGEPIGVEQFVAIKPGPTYRLKLDVRPSDANAKVSVVVCEKWLLTSARCVEANMDLKGQKAAWRSIELDLNTKDLLPVAPLFARPLKVSLTHSIAKTTLDFDNVQLLDPSGRNLLRNGGFSDGMDNWFFSVAGTLHAHWRTHSLFVSALFDTGWVGLTALLAFLGIAAGLGARAAWQGDVWSSASLAALAGFMTGGLLDTQIDTPRFLMLLLLLAWACRNPPSSPKSRSV